jgi:hypothetical protein
LVFVFVRVLHLEVGDVRNLKRGAVSERLFFGVAV